MRRLTTVERISAMTREQAIAIAEQYVAAKGLSVGPVCAAWFSDGSEYIECTPSPPSWTVHFAYNGPPWEELPEERREILSVTWDAPTIVSVDDVSGRAELVMLL